MPPAPAQYQAGGGARLGVGVGRNDGEARHAELCALAPELRDGDIIRKTFTLDSFADAVAFVNRIAELAERADHHPDIDIRYDRVACALSTHSEGGLTRKDFDLARQLDAAR